VCEDVHSHMHDDPLLTGEEEGVPCTLGVTVGVTDDVRDTLGVPEPLADAPGDMEVEVVAEGGGEAPVEGNVVALGDELAPAGDGAPDTLLLGEREVVTDAEGGGEVVTEADAGGVVVAEGEAGDGDPLADGVADAPLLPDTDGVREGEGTKLGLGLGLATALGVVLVEGLGLGLGNGVLLGPGLGGGDVNVHGAPYG
jgi:hypothetical protein